MSTEIRVPMLGESVTEATIAQWFKRPGDQVAADEPLVELETDKVTLEVPAPASGVLADIAASDGSTVEVGALLGSIDESGAAVKPKTEAKAEPAAPKPAAAGQSKTGEAETAQAASNGSGAMPPSPSARKLMAEHNLATGEVRGSGKRGQVLKSDVLAALEAKAPGEADAETPPAARVRDAPTGERGSAGEERVRMTRLRQTIAKRLKAAQDTAAMLTTFNEVDMSAVMELRNAYKELFEKKHGVKLGFMGFFVKACVAALREIPAVNAEIDGTDLVYKNYYHIGVAVGTDRGLVVPVVRDAQDLSIAEIETRIGELGRAARKGELAIEDMQGGTFTISNGGVYGSLMSTPILNAPQSGILGMHKIQERAVVIDGALVARPMMYLALTYDHRIVDGKEAVTFLVRVKESIEDPQRLVLEL
jgi:2-oxoglutarate dehydrogenase E2 component (dihydrolipoamide succinyltransferase)